MKNVIDMQLSDSADSLLKVEFKKHKSILKIKSLERYLKVEYGKDNCIVYLIPLSYSFRQMPCPQNIKMTTLYNYYKFNGKSIIGNCILLNPIGSLESIQR